MKTILLIDDDANIRLTFSLVLRHFGYRVLEADSGDAGLAIARRRLPDLIITDVVMPGTDGKSVLQQIRHDPALSSKQVVMITGHPDEVSPRRGMELGADDFLLKPVRLDELARCVEARLGRAEAHERVEDRVLNRLRDRLHATLPTEFSEPVAGIIGLTEMLRSRAREWTRDEIDGVLADIANTAVRLQRVQRNYLLILDQGDEAPAYLKADLLPLHAVKSAIGDGVELAADRTGRTKDVRLDLEAVPLLVSATDLSLIAEELADNACNYSAGGTQVKILLDAKGNLTISDSGRGMSSEEIKQMGLFQSLGSRNSSERILGLGLVLVQKLAAKWGAIVALESTSDGTKVTVSFRISTK